MAKAWVYRLRPNCSKRKRLGFTPKGIFDNFFLALDTKQESAVSRTGSTKLLKRHRNRLPMPRESIAWIIHEATYADL